MNIIVNGNVKTYIVGVTADQIENKNDFIIRFIKTNKAYTVIESMVRSLELMEENRNCNIRNQNDSTIRPNKRQKPDQNFEVIYGSD